MQPNRLLNMNGQSLSISDHTGKFGWFLSGSRQETDRRIDPPIPDIFHDHGFDYFLYGKADYLLSDKDYLTLNLNYGITNTQVPYDSVEIGGSYNPPQAQDDQQYTTNAFQTLTYNRTISTESDHESNLMIAGYAREETEEKFKGMLNAFRYGAPPHGGTAPGIDRIVMLLAGEENLREVTMFPMTQSAQDLLMNAPSPANEKQLKELHLKIVYPEK